MRKKLKAAVKFKDQLRTTLINPNHSIIHLHDLTDRLMVLVPSDLGSVERCRISVDAVKPRVPWRLGDSTHGTPHHTVALEARAKSKLPNTVPSSHTLLCFHVSQLIPNAAARGVAKAVQCHPRCLHVLVTQLQVPLKLIKNGLACSMHTKVLKSQFVVRNVWLLHWWRASISFASK